MDNMYSPIAAGSYGCVFVPGLQDNNNKRPKDGVLSKVLKKEDAEDEINELNNILLYSDNNTLLNRKVKQGIFVLPENLTSEKLGEFDVDDLENFDKMCGNVLEVSSNDINNMLDNFRKIDYKNKGLPLDKLFPSLIKKDLSVNKTRLNTFLLGINNLLNNVVIMNKEGLIHYDMKSGNLVATDTRLSSISIIDWGFSRIYSIPSVNTYSQKASKKDKIKFLNNYFDLDLSKKSNIKLMYKYYGVDYTTKTDNASINEMYNLVNSILPQYAWIYNSPYSSCVFSTAFPYDDNSELSMRSMTNDYKNFYPQTIFNNICQQFKFQIEYKYNEINIFTQVNNLKLFLDYKPDYTTKYSFKMKDKSLLNNSNSTYIELLANIATDYIYSIINIDFKEYLYFKDVYMYNVDIWGALTVLFDMLKYFKSIGLNEVPNEILKVIELVYFSSTYSNKKIDIDIVQNILKCVNKTTKMCKELRNEEEEEEIFFDTLTFDTDPVIYSFKDELYEQFTKYKDNFSEFLQTVDKQTRVRCLRLFTEFVNWFINYVKDMSSHLQELNEKASIQDVMVSFKETKLIIQEQLNLLTETLLKEREYKTQETVDNTITITLNERIDNLEQGDLKIDNILNYVRDYIILKNGNRIKKNNRITPIDGEIQKNELGFIKTDVSTKKLIPINDEVDEDYEFGFNF
jgi:hypothetical protein